MNVEGVPRRATPDEVRAIGRRRAGLNRIDWRPMADGEWWTVYEAGPGEDPADRMREFDRIRKSAHKWGSVNGMDVEVRRQGSARIVMVRMSRLEA